MIPPATPRKDSTKPSFALVNPNVDADAFLLLDSTPDIAGPSLAIISLPFAVPTRESIVGCS